MKISQALTLVTGIILTLGAIPAGASTLNRTWVASSGADGSSCGIITSPCLTFAGALANTAANGEIDCLTPGDFGPVTINKAVSIICDGVSNGGIQDTSGTPIQISAPSGAMVYLSGLDLNGVGTGLYGVAVNTGSTVYINRCTVRSFLHNGVLVNSTTNPTRVIIKDSIIVSNAGGGVWVTSGGTGGAVNAALLVNTIVDANGTDALIGNAADGVVGIALEGSTISGSPTAINLLDGATAELIGPSNAIAGTINGTTTSVDFK
jgi:hypothetical protein